ncbi:MAG: 4Fe-4S binding protein [bacterium]
MIHGGGKPHRNINIILFAALWALLFAAVAWAQEEGGGSKPPGVIDLILLPRFWVGAIFAIVGLALMMTKRAKRRLRLVWLGIAFFTFGIIGVLPWGGFAAGMGLHPSPVCAITRPFQFLDRGGSIPAIFWIVTGFIALFSIVGNKLFCGWVCPLGALQELVGRIKLHKKTKKAMRLKKTIPFRVSNTIRVLVAVAFFPVVFTTGRSIYDYFNPFESFHWGFAVSTTIILAVTLVAALFLFRPFCYLICPIGLFTWVLEHISFVRLRLSKNECNDCDACLKLTNCPAVAATLAGKKSRPDCHACGECMNVCPKNALTFR